MKSVFLLLTLFITLTAQATTYYVSAAGSDANNGTSTATPWQTITKVNSFSFAANDVILFKRSNTFYGSINVNINYLTFGSYDTGNDAIITGYTTVSASAVWTPIGKVTAAGRAYTTTLSTGIPNLLVVSVDNTLREMGRYPNSDAADGGYLTYEGVPSPLSGSIRDDNSPTVPADWSTAEICVRKEGAILERNKITGINVSGAITTYTFSPTNSINPYNYDSKDAHAGHGYFIQNAVSTLNKPWEWCYNPANNNFSIYTASVPSNYIIKLSTVDVLMNIGNKHHITVENLQFTGANKSAVYSYTPNTSPAVDAIIVRNCAFTDIGGRAVHLLYNTNPLIENCTFNWCLSTGVQVYYPADSYAPSNCTIRNCTFNNIAPFNGMGSFCDKGDYNAIHCNNQNSLIELNKIENVGKAGILWQGNNVTIQKNFLNNTMKFFNDYGAIYTYTGGNPNFSGRTISNNIILNTMAQNLGTNDTKLRGNGIYCDGKTMEVNITNNSIVYSARNGIHCNNPYHINITGNTLYNNVNAISFARWTGTTGGLNIDIPQLNINISNNISYSLDETHNNIYYTNQGLTTNSPAGTTIASDLAAIGNINNNYYGQVNQVPFKLEIYNSVGAPLTQTSPMSLQAWQALSTKDAASVNISKLKTYVVDGIALPPNNQNWFPNYGFNTDNNGITTTNYATSLWDGTSQITGTGSLRINFLNTDPNGYSIHTSGNLGSLLNSSKYLLSFKTRGTGINGIVTASLDGSQLASQTHAYNATIVNHEFLFTNPQAVPAIFSIKLERNSGTTYIDDVKFGPVQATLIPLSTSVRFDYNNTNSPVTVLLPINEGYEDAAGASYTGTITLQPYTSSLLFKNALKYQRPMPIQNNPIFAESTSIEVTCYPNPATSILTINNLNVKDEWQTVEIISLDGKATGILSKINTGNGKQTFTISKLSAGKYYAILTNKQTKTKVLSFIKL